MYLVFFACAVIAGTVFVLQFLMAVVGFGLDADFMDQVPDDIPDDIPDGVGSSGHGSTWIFGVISFKTVVTALTFFGLAGLAGLSADIGEFPSLAIAVVFGLASMYVVHWMMQLLVNLGSDGTVRIKNSVGVVGSVYIPIPPNHEGSGKVQLKVQGRIVEYVAQTASSQRLLTGTAVEVTRVISPNVVEVAVLSESHSAESELPEQPAEAH